MEKQWKLWKRWKTIEKYGNCGKPLKLMESMKNNRKL